jgi:hypothetical protein
MRKDRRNRADPAGRFRSPRSRVKMLDKNLVHALIRGKDPDCGWAELSVNLLLTRGHGSNSLIDTTSGPRSSFLQADS